MTVLQYVLRTSNKSRFLPSDSIYPVEIEVGWDVRKVEGEAGRVVRKGEEEARRDARKGEEEGREAQNQVPFRGVPWIFAIRL